MKRVFTNLISNAVDAVEEKAKEADPNGPAARPAVLIATVFDSDFSIAKITIIDNGVGIPHRDRARVFEPYYSTKVKGTGLGLPIVKSIIEDHSGVIRALPNEPHGTKIYIEIPVKLELKI